MIRDVAKAIKVPFDPYDFFGYLLPGTFFGFGIAFIFWFANGTQRNWQYTLAEFGKLFGEFKIIPGFLIAALVIIVFYLLGHFVASFGSMILEKLLVKGAIGYPYTWYLGLRIYEERRFSESVYRWVFVLVNGCGIFGLLTISDQAYGGLFHLSIWVLISLLGIRFVTNLVKVWLFKPEPVLDFGRKYVLKNPKLDPVVGRTARFTVCGFHLITKHTITLVSSLLTSSTGALDELNEDFIKKYDTRFRSDFSADYRAARTNNFWFCYIYLLNNCPAAAAMARNFLHMYSFARNMATACFLLIAVEFGAVWLFSDSPVEYNNRSYLSYAGLIIYVIGIVMLLRYFYLYSSYFTRFVFRAYLCAPEQLAPGSVNQPQA